MKRAIWVTLLALAVSIFSTSCTKTSLNTIAIIGEWELVKVEEFANGKVLNTWYPGDHGERDYLEFQSGDIVISTIVDAHGTSTTTGTWTIDEDILIMSMAGQATMEYTIEKANLSQLILSYVYVEDGISITSKATLKNI